MEENETDQMDMICQGCVTKHPFLVHYDGQSISQRFLRICFIFCRLESRQEISMENNSSKNNEFSSFRRLFFSFQRCEFSSVVFFIEKHRTTGSKNDFSSRSMASSFVSM